MHALFGAGYDYTYLYPGLQKVVQAAGRVIRTPSDEGVVHLMDDRFGQAQVRALLPHWWGLHPRAGTPVPRQDLDGGAPLPLPRSASDILI